MKYILLFLLPFVLSAQTDHLSDAKHFYGSFAVDCAIHRLQYVYLPNQQEHNRIFISNGVTVLAIFSKEVYDMYKPKPTGFDKLDIATGLWAILVYDVCQIVYNDVRHNNALARRRKYDVYN